MKNIAIAAALLAWGPAALALNPNRQLSQIQKHVWQIEDSLPHNYVNAILHDPEGYLLIGTDEGLARFDGVRFSAPPVDGSLHLDRRWIMGLAASRRGGYWVGTYDGAIYRVENGSARERLSPGGTVQSLFEDSGGNLWYQAGPIHRRDAGGREQLLPECSANGGNSWQNFAEDNRGAVWIVHAGGLCRYRGGRMEQVFAFGEKEGSGLAILAERRGTMWVGTSRGVFQVNNLAGSPTLTRLPGPEAPISHLLRDRDGTLWAATWGKGLMRLGTKTAQWSSREGLADDFVRTIFEDHEGNLWFGSRSGGLSRWKDTLIDPLGIPEGLGGNFASAVSGDPSGTIWLGTYRSGLYQVREGSVRAVETPVPPLDLVIGAMASDPGGYLWVSAWHGMFRFGPSGHSSFTDRMPGGCSAPVAVAVDGRRQMWLGCGSGLYRFPSAEPARETVSHFLEDWNIRTLLAASDGTLWAGAAQGLAHVAGDKVERFDAADFPDPTVRYISEDAQHRIWVTTNGPGLTLVSVGKPRTLEVSTGLPPRGLFKLVDDGRGAVWVSSSHGIVEIPTSQLDEWVAGRRQQVDAVVHDTDDGMRTIECHGVSQPGGWRHSDGTLWFPTAKGFVRIQPALRRRQAPPAVVVEEVRTSSGSLPPGPVRLAAGTREVEVQYTALRFSSSDHVQFRYRLEGAEAEWTLAGRNRTVRFPSLAPGSYRLLVSARDDGGEWSADPATLAIEQEPRFHQTVWFRLLVVLACAAGAVVLFQWRVRGIRGQYAAISAERNRIAREWHDTLLAGLSGVSWQLEAVRTRLQAHPEQATSVLETARKMVEHCAAEARRVIWDLRDNAPDSPPLEEAIRAFLDQQCTAAGIEGSVEVRGTRAGLQRDLEHNALRVAQEAIANAVHHGQPGRIQVLVEYTANQLMLQVSDNGRGFVPREADGAGTHFGILGMRERLLSFGGRFTLESAPGEGTRVRAEFPIARGVAK